MSNKYNDDISDKLNKIFNYYDDELLAEATNIYHNTDNDKSVEDIVSDLRKQYLDKVLSCDMTFTEVENKLAQYMR
tara:strand:- start:1510 stop:1737 length:228 start_codon:yes stop_codon:yes gene_type:complete